eukprot:364259-Chlamydomonas_euryale.AAC.3
MLLQLQPGCAARCRPVIACPAEAPGCGIVGLSYHCPTVPLRGLTDLASRRGQDRVSRVVERYSLHPRTLYTASEFASGSRLDSIHHRYPLTMVVAMQCNGHAWLMMTW